MPRRVRYVGPVVIELHTKRLFLPGGPVYRWKQSVEREVREVSERQAPVNVRPNKNPRSPKNPYGGVPAGSLKASIKSSIAGTPEVFQITISAEAGYSAWVHEGTGRIFSRGAGGRFGTAREGMILPGNVVGGGIHAGRSFRKGRPRRQSVRGQTANPFLRRSIDIAGLKHSSLRGAGRSAFLTTTRPG